MSHMKTSQGGTASFVSGHFTGLGFFCPCFIFVSRFGKQSLVQKDAMFRHPAKRGPFSSPTAATFRMKANLSVQP